MKTKVIACLLAVTLVGTCHSFGSKDKDPADSGAVAIDALLVRPVCFAGTIIGSAIYVISLPVALTSKSMHRASKALVVQPAKATFKRPLGEFDNWTDY